MKSRTAVLLVGGALALGLGACGGGGSSEEGDAHVSKGPLTTPGTKLKFGQAARLVWVPPSLGLEGKSDGPRLKVTVDSIEKGSIGDFGGVELKPDEEDSTPYYMHLSIEALEEVPASIEDEADTALMAIDDRGQEHFGVIFGGEFPTCEDERTPKPMKPGDSFESCMTYLMPGGGSIVEANWNNGREEPDGEVTPYFEEPVVWAP
jgi:hypothetical protein